MNRLAWRSSYSVGVAELDRQHEGLLDLVNRLVELRESGATDKSQFAVLNELVRYAESHFALEEDLMGRHAYPALAEHAESHRQFVARVFAFNQRLGSADRTLPAELLDFLKTWYIDHVLGEDRGYVDLFKERGVR